MRDWIEGVVRRRHSKHLFSLQRLHPSNRDANIRCLQKSVHTVYLGENRAVCRVLGRYIMSVATNDSGLAPHLMMNGYWELGLTEAIVKRARRGMSMLDVGANVGYYTILFAGLCGPEGRVIAVEPDQDSVEHLSRSVSLNGFEDRVEIVPAALGSEEGTGRLLRTPGKPMNAQINLESHRGVTVPIMTVDALTDFVDMIKIDVEGSEERVWGGMTRVLNARRSLCMFLEFNSSRFDSPSDFLQQIPRYGFRMSRIEPNGERVVDQQAILSFASDQDQILILER